MKRFIITPSHTATITVIGANNWLVGKRYDCFYSVAHAISCAKDIACREHRDINYIQIDNHTTGESATYSASGRKIY